MDLESDKNNQRLNKSLLSINLITTIKSKGFQLRKVVSFLNKHLGQINLCDQFVQMYESTQQYLIQINVLTIIQYLLTHSSDFNEQNEQRLRWTFHHIYQIRQYLDKINQLNEQQLQSLDKLLTIMNNLNAFLSTKVMVKNTRMSEKSIFQEYVDFILFLSSDKPFANVANNLFQANLLLKIIEINPLIYSSHEILIRKIMYHLQFVECNSNKLDEMTQSILLTTYVKSVKYISNFYSYFLQRLPNIIQIFPINLKLRLLHEFNINKVEYLMPLICEDQDDLQLISLIINNCYLQFPEQQGKLSEIWINNLYSLIQQQVHVQTSSIINGFEDTILINIYFKLSQLIQSSPNLTERRNIIFQMWGVFLLADKVYNIVVNNKSIMINLEVLVFKFQREIQGALPFSIHNNLYKLVLTVFAKYYPIILKQNECKQINKQTILFITHQYPELLNQSFFFKERTLTSTQNIVNFDLYHLEYIELLARKCIQKPNLGVFLSVLNKRVSKIVLKYLIDANVLSLTSLLIQDDIILYTIQNDIQLHLDKYDHLLQNKFYQHLQKYLPLVSNRQHKNRYRNALITCLLNLLINQLETASNRKLIDVNSKNLIFIIENMDLLVNLSQQQMLPPSQLFNALLSLAIRSLYYNIPLIANYLIITVLAIKNKILSITLEKEVSLLHELVKFCKMYNSQRQYQLIGFTILLQVIYGLPTYIPNLSKFSDILKLLQSNNYLLQNISQIFINQAQRIDQIINFNILNFNSCQLFKKIFHKCLSLGLIRHLSFVAEYTQQIHRQAKHINNVIAQLINNEVALVKNKLSSLAGLNRKRKITQENFQENENNHQKQPVQNWLQSLLDQIIQFNEFQQYKLLQSKISLLNNNRQISCKLTRVHGKIRTIIHVTK